MTTTNTYIQHTDELERQLWEICADAWFINASADQWWVIVARCPHGRFEGTSRGTLGLAEAFTGIVHAAREGHRAAEREDATKSLTKLHEIDNG